MKEMYKCFTLYCVSYDKDGQIHRESFPPLPREKNQPVEQNEAEEVRHIEYEEVD